jgi:hypothetical protein
MDMRAIGEGLFGVQVGALESCDIELCLRCKKSPALKHVFQCCILVLKCSRVYRRSYKFLEVENDTHLCISLLCFISWPSMLSYSSLA